MTRRLEFQKKYAIPPIIDLGVGENPARFGDEVVRVDMDVWRYPYFIQADLHNLPIRDNSFRTAILGDVLEHVLDPRRVLSEAKRIAGRIVITIFEEWRLGHGQHIDKARQLFFPVEPGYDPFIKSGRCKRLISENQISHSPHINQFSDEDVKEMIDNLRMKTIHFSKEPESTHQGHTWQNWLICLEKE